MSLSANSRILKRAAQFKLSPRQLESMLMVARGKSYKDISAELNISLVAIHGHLHKARLKLGASNNPQAVAILLD